MDFYDSIRPWYDLIFPFSEAQRDFVLSFGEDSSLSVVDVGCGTGSLIVSLARTFRKTAALEPDEEMIMAARNHASTIPVATWFSQLGMLDLTREFGPQTTDRLICFGNTISHLANESEVGEFAGQIAKILKPGGLALIQMINYDRIIRNNLKGLPEIENEAIRFERYYAYPENPERIRFITKLTIKDTGQVIENDIPLLALRPKQLLAHFERAGFIHLNTFGSFKKTPFTEESQPLILVAQIS